MKIIYLVVILVMSGNIACAEVLLKGSVVCWGERTLEKYVVSDEPTKRHMEDHECLVWNKDMQAEVISIQDVTVSGDTFFIANIVLRYEYYGKRADNVWTFTKNLSKLGAKESVVKPEPETVKDYISTVVADEEGHIGDGEYLLGAGKLYGGSVFTIKASSSLKNYKSMKYNPKQAHDYKAFTAWIEGKPGYGVGEYLEYKYDFTKANKTDYFINRIIIYNGYWKSKTLWKANSRIKKLKILLNSKPHEVVTLEDSQEMQIIKIPDIIFEPLKVYILRCEILDVYQGTKYKDTAISELQFAGI
jgi:hypothetical protein